MILNFANFFTAISSHVREFQVMILMAIIIYNIFNNINNNLISWPATSWHAQCVQILYNRVIIESIKIWIKSLSKLLHFFSSYLLHKNFPTHFSNHFEYWNRYRVVRIESKSAKIWFEYLYRDSRSFQPISLMEFSGSNPWQGGHGQSYWRHLQLGI